MEVVLSKKKFLNFKNGILSSLNHSVRVNLITYFHTSFIRDNVLLISYQ